MVVVKLVDVTVAVVVVELIVDSAFTVLVGVSKLAAVGVGVVLEIRVFSKLKVVSVEVGASVVVASVGVFSGVLLLPIDADGVKVPVSPGVVNSHVSDKYYLENHNHLVVLPLLFPLISPTFLGLE